MAQSIAMRLAATAWTSSAGTTRGFAVTSKTPAEERTVSPIVRPRVPRGGRMTRTCVASRPGPASAAATATFIPCGKRSATARAAFEEYLGLKPVAGREIDEHVEALEAGRHRGGDAVAPGPGEGAGCDPERVPVATEMRRTSRSMAGSASRP